MVRAPKMNVNAMTSKKFPEIITEDKGMLDLLKMAEVVAKSDTTVLIQGESGTGKELLARGIHRLSQVAPGPYLAVNCAAVPADLLESEFFGWERGAFSGAVTQRAGRFEQAQNGSMVLDEIGDMPLSLQAKILRVLQTKELDRLGGNDSIDLNVRFMATTNKDIRSMVDEGTFREDLFYRLSVFPLVLPPLRERKGDVKTLARYYVNVSASAKEISDEAIEKLEAHNWPGNVRELENIIRRATILAHDSDTIHANHIMIESARASREISGMAGTTLKDMEMKLIMETLSACDGNRSKASKVLDISVRTLRNKLREYQNAAGL